MIAVGGECLHMAGFQSPSGETSHEPPLSSIASIVGTAFMLGTQATATALTWDGGAVDQSKTDFDNALTNPNYGRTPVGLMLNECALEIPTGAVVDNIHRVINYKNEFYADMPACQRPLIQLPNGPVSVHSADGGSSHVVPTTNGWYEWTVADANLNQIGNIAYFDELLGQWNVPPAPTTNHAQTIFLFNSLQNVFGGFIQGIIQPVLQWGPSAAGTPAGWGIAVWNVQGSSTVFSTLVAVAVGDVLSGSIIMTAPTTYAVTMTDITSGQFTTMSFQFNPATDGIFSTANSAVLETYNTQKCSDLPNIPAQPPATFNPFNFIKGQVFQAGPNWNSLNNETEVLYDWTEQFDTTMTPNCGPGVGQNLADPNDPGFMTSTIQWNP